MKTCICAIARNENHYIKEWCEYHLNIGFDYIEIFDNNDIDGEEIETETSQFGQKVNVNRKFRGKTDRMHQTEAYTLFYNTHKEYDWIAFIDIDEFIYLEHNNIKGFISKDKFTKSDGVRLGWMCFTDNNLITVDGNWSINRFTTPSIAYSTQAKTIIRGNLPYVKKIWVHTSFDLKNAVNALGEKCWNDGDAKHRVNLGPSRIWEEAYIKHYRYKTLQEFLDIKMKNWNQKNIKNKYIDIKHFWDINEKTNEKLKYLKERGITY